VVEILYEKSAGAVIVRKEKEPLFLLICNKGNWDFPKGNIEKGEKELDTVKREVKEETGIDDIKIIGGFREVISYYYKRDGKLVSKDVIFYLAVTKTKDVVLSYEHEDYKWLTYEEAYNHLSFENSRRVLKKAREALKKIASLKDFIK